jgi:hypothetical protein
MVLVEFKSDKKYAKFTKHSYGSIEKALPDIKDRLRTQKAVAVKINGRSVFGVSGDKIIYMDNLEPW